MRAPARLCLVMDLLGQDLFLGSLLQESLDHLDLSRGRGLVQPACEAPVLGIALELEVWNDDPSWPLSLSQMAVASDSINQVWVWFSIRLTGAWMEGRRSSGSMARAKW